MPSSPNDFFLCIQNCMSNIVDEIQKCKCVNNCEYSSKSSQPDRDGLVGPNDD